MQLLRQGPPSVLTCLQQHSRSSSDFTHFALQDPMEDEDGPILLDEFGQPVVQVR